MHEEDFGNGSKWAKLSDAVLKLKKGENQNSQEYTLYLAGRNKPKIELKMAYDSESGKWHRISDK